MRCADCQWKYPDVLLHEMMIQGEYTESICGICALERVNLLHDAQMKEFPSEGAETMRLGAIRWRITHPQDAPQVN